MIQRIIACIALGLIGLVSVCVPGKVWYLTERWKYRNGSEPSDGYLRTTRIVGVFLMLVAAAVGSGKLL